MMSDYTKIQTYTHKGVEDILVEGRVYGSFGEVIEPREGLRLRCVDIKIAGGGTATGYVEVYK
jgi:hypothetical protein